MDDQYLKDQIFYWLTEHGDFDRCTDSEEIERACQKMYPNLYAALIDKRRARRMFSLELSVAMAE